MRTRKERVSDKIRNNFSACTVSLIDDRNVHLIYRTLANFCGKEMFIIGSDAWFKGATNGIGEHVPITYFKSESEFLSFIKNTDYRLVCVEQSDSAIDMYDIASYPDNSCFVFGNESFGLYGDLLKHSELTVEIKTNGIHPCFNVGVSSGIIISDFYKKNVKGYKYEISKAS